MSLVEIMLSAQADKIKELEKENFALSAGMCIVGDGVFGNDGGTPTCPLQARIDYLESRVIKLEDDINRLEFGND